MKKTIIATLIVAVLTFAATSFGTIIPASGSSGGGGSGGGTPILIGTYLDQSINFKNFSMTGHASNWSSGNASFNGKMRLGDGFYDSTFDYAGMRQEYYGDPQNERTVYTVAEAWFYTHKGMSNLVKPSIDFKTSSNIFFPGIDISSGSSIKNQNGSNGMFPNIYSPSYDYNVNIWVNDGTISTMNVDPFWNQDGTSILYTRFFVGINLRGDLDKVIAFTSNLKSLPQELEANFITVPEPATIALLGLGGILFRKRK